MENEKIHNHGVVKEGGSSANHRAIKPWSPLRRAVYRYPGPARANRRISPSEKRIQRSQARLRFTNFGGEFIEPAPWHAGGE